MRPPHCRHRYSAGPRRVEPTTREPEHRSYGSALRLSPTAAGRRARADAGAPQAPRRVGGHGCSASVWPCRSASLVRNRRPPLPRQFSEPLHVGAHAQPSSAANPSLTIQAIAARTADFIKDRARTGDFRHPLPWSLGDALAAANVSWPPLSYAPRSRWRRSRVANRQSGGQALLAERVCGDPARGHAAACSRPPRCGVGELEPRCVAVDPARTRPPRSIHDLGPVQASHRFPCMSPRRLHRFLPTPTAAALGRPYDPEWWRVSCGPPNGCAPQGKQHQRRARRPEEHHGH